MLRRRDLDPPIEKELQFHIDAQVDQYVEAGLAPDEAARRARADFGSMQQIKEEVRDVWAWRWFADAVQDLLFALRTYQRMPVFAVTAVSTLALGIGVNTALFSIVRQVLFTTLPVANPQELVEIECNSRPGTTGGGGSCMQSYPALRLLSERHDGLSGVFAFAPVPNGLVASFEGRRELITGQLASATIFDVLGVHPAAGRLFVESDDRAGAEPVAVLDYSYWRRAFAGDRAVIGQTLVLNHRTVAIVGVLPRTFRGVTFGAVYDVFLPLGTTDLFRTGPPSRSGGTTSLLGSANMGWLTFMGRRQRGLSDQQIAARLEPVFRQSVDAMIAPIPLDVRKRLNLGAENIRVDVRRAAFGAASDLRRTLEPTLRVLTVIAVLVLLIACANLASLFLSQATSRHREFGLRLALGAGRSRLLRQVFTETLLLAVIGAGLGLLVAQWIGPAGFTLATDETGLRAVDLAPDRWMLAFTAALSVVASLGVGAVVILRASSADPQDALRKVRVAGSPRLTKAMLVAQIAFTITLVGSAALFLQTLTNFRRIDVGFQPNQLLTVTMDAGLRSLERTRADEYIRQASERLSALPGVRSVTYANKAIGTGVPMALAVDVPGFAGSPDTASSGEIFAGPGFVRTSGLTLLAGKDFEAPDPRTAGSAIVNESFASFFFGTVDIVGRSFALRGPGNPPIQIAGVVKDARDRGVKRPTGRMMYLPFDLSRAQTVTFTVRGENAVSTLSGPVRRTLEQLDPAVGIAKMTTADAELDDVLRRERLLAALGTVFGGLAVALVAIGLYGLLNTLVVRRTTEIGVRMALGAPRTHIVWMVARETVVLLFVGVGLGVAGHAIAAHLVRSQLFGVEPSDPAAAAGAVLVLLVIAVIAVWVPARRATRIDPMAALRNE